MTNSLSRWAAAILTGAALAAAPDPGLAAKAASNAASKADPKSKPGSAAPASPAPAAAQAPAASPAPVAAPAAGLATKPAPKPDSKQKASSTAVQDPDMTWQQLGDAFESTRLLDAAARLPKLQAIERSLVQVLKDDPDDERRMAVRFLSARLRWEQGDWVGAASGFRSAADAAEKTSFADDATFASIEALEASGRDAEAAKEWIKWEKRFPASSLLPAARLARAWNALRRGETGEAEELLNHLATDSPWIVTEQRYVLASALAHLMAGRETLALEVLGERPTSAPALYLRGLCLARLGQLLKAAAAWQEVAERWSQGPLAEHARLAKANTFLTARDYRSAAEEMARVAARVKDPAIKAEAELRAAGALFLATGSTDSVLTLLRGVVARHEGTDVAARAQFLVGEALVARQQYEPAIKEYNRVLTRYFQHKVAASSQYRVARCLDALGRRADATGSYQAVVSGYPLEPEAPAAAYLAGVGLLHRDLPRAAVPYFQIVLDRYARPNAEGAVVFARPEHQELVEAALCMLEWSWHRAGDMGQVAGATHLLLQKMPASRSPWRAWALVVDADALAAIGRYDEAQSTLERLAKEFPDHSVSASATQLLAWTYARQGQDSLAIATEERLLARWGATGDEAIVSGAFLDIAHARFNQKRYREAAGAYEDFLRRWPAHRQRATALYQAGLCYLRLDRAGDAVDRWEALVKDSASAAISERAWARAGDVYFQAEKFDAARRCYLGLLEHFGASPAAGLASLRLAQCEYNAGHDAAALEGFSATIQKFPGTPYAKEAQRGTELALYRLASSANGEAVLAQLVEQYPNSAFAADALLQIARRHYQAKRWSEAAEGFRQVVTRFPSYSSADQAQFLMADALAQSGAGAEARNAYDQFLSYFPDSDLKPTASFRLGLLQFEAKEFMRAAVAFTTALEDSASAEVRDPARYNLALCHRQLGDLVQARAELERYRQEFPAGAQAAEAVFQIADLDEAAGNLPAAASGFDQALNMKHGAALGAEIAFRLGRCREQLADVPGAIRAYQEARACTDRDEPFRLSALARLAALHESRKEYTRAIEAYRDIMKNSQDRELVVAAEERVEQLSASTRRR
jgi:TolA-binding protein